MNAIVTAGGNAMVINEENLHEVGIAIQLLKEQHKWTTKT
jgi:hypothetical protein